MNKEQIEKEINGSAIYIENSIPTAQIVEARLFDEFTVNEDREIEIGEVTIDYPFIDEPQKSTILCHLGDDWRVEGWFAYNCNARNPDELELCYMNEFDIK
jgi:hypothetical protein